MNSRTRSAVLSVTSPPERKRVTSSLFPTARFPKYEADISASSRKASISLRMVAVCFMRPMYPPQRICQASSNKDVQDWKVYARQQL